jgi:hypothetical protein
MTATNNNSLMVAKAIDEVALEVSAAFMQPGAGFTKAIAVAKGVADLRAALTPEVMKDMMALMNTSIGFRTDRDPKQINTKTGKPHEPYSEEIVKDCLVEACLRGFYPVNNEFNIIAERFYACVNGLERKVRTSEKVANFKEWFGLPQMNGQGGAIVKARAEWTQEGHAQVLERDFAIRVNSGMGADAVIGKAKRKLYAAVYARLSGVVTEDDDVTDIETTATPVAAAATPEAMFGGKPAAPAAEKKDDDQIPGAEVRDAGQPPTELKTAVATLQSELARFLGDCKVSFDDFRDFIAAKGIHKDTSAWASFDDVPDKVCQTLKDSTKMMSELVRKFGKVQAK